MDLNDMDLVIFATGRIGEEKPSNYYCAVTEEKDKVVLLKFMLKLEEKKKKAEPNGKN